MKFEIWKVLHFYILELDFQTQVRLKGVLTSNGKHPIASSFDIIIIHSSSSSSSSSSSTLYHQSLRWFKPWLSETASVHCFVESLLEWRYIDLVCLCKTSCLNLQIKQDCLNLDILIIFKATGQATFVFCQDYVCCIACSIQLCHEHHNWDYLLTFMIKASFNNIPTSSVLLFFFCQFSHYFMPSISISIAL